MSIMNEGTSQNNPVMRGEVWQLDPREVISTNNYEQRLRLGKAAYIGVECNEIKTESHNKGERPGTKAKSTGTKGRPSTKTRKDKETEKEIGNE